MLSELDKKRFLKRYLITIIVWLVVILVGFSGPTALNSEITSSTNIISTDTNSYYAAELSQERFNGSTEDTQHIIILELKNDEKVTDNKWNNYTLFMTNYLFHHLENKGYDDYLSAPTIGDRFGPALQSLADEISRSFISEDNSTTMIIISSSTLILGEDDLTLEEHVPEIRELLSNYDKLVEYINEFEVEQEVEPNTFVSYIPTKDEINDNLNQVLTGTVANVVDTLDVSESSFRNSEIIAGLVIFVILFIVFRTPLAIFIPLLSTIAALFPAYLISAILGQLGVIVINSFLPAVIAMIGIAVAVDYNLFSLVRYREEYRKRRAEYELNNNWNDSTRKETEIYCSQKMNSTAGQAAMYSGITTLIGFSSLLITQNEFSVAMAIGVSLVVAMSILTTRSLTPAILAFAGRYLDWPNVLSRADKEIEFNKEKNVDLQGFWVKWSRLVMKRPLVFLLIGVIIMMPFVVLSAQTELSFSLTKGLPPGTESREGFEILENRFNLGDLNPYIVVIDGGVNNNSIFNDRLIETVNLFSAKILSFSGEYEPENQDLEFDTVTTMSALFNSSTNEMDYFDMAFLQDVFDLPDNLTIETPFGNFTTENPEKSLFLQHVKQYINWDMGNNTLQIEITSNLDPGSGAAWELVNVITSYVNEYFQPLIDDSIIEQALVTGFTALIKESSDGLYERVPLMLVVAVLLIFLSLLVLFRSVILPIKAILTIAGSILFGMGTLVYIFQLGYIQLIEFFGFTLWEAELSGITYFLPTFLFTTILGLGMDYSIFIISRIKEEFDISGDMDGSVGVGLSKTAGIITSAATIMTATFLVFAASPLLTLKMMGLAMAVAIVIDATIARTILLPAAMRLAGVYNFWIPKWLEKILPDVKLEH